MAAAHGHQRLRIGQGIGPAGGTARREREEHGVREVLHRQQRARRRQPAQWQRQRQTGQPDQRRMIKELSNFGINLSPDKDHPVGHLSYAGTNAKLSEYHAAVGLASLNSWQAQANRRHEVFVQLRETLQQSCGDALTWQQGPAPAAPTTFSVRVGSSLRRQQLEQSCAVSNISTRRWYQPLLHQHAAKVGPIVHLPTPTAEAVSDDLIGLPFFPTLTKVQMAEISRHVAKAVGI